jgi:hypothetical protein
MGENQPMEKKTVVLRPAPIYFVILSLICITFISGCCRDGMDIKVKKSMTTDLKWIPAYAGEN